MVRDEITKILTELTGTDEVNLETPENEAFGDYSTNIALQVKNQKSCPAGRRAKVKIATQNPKLVAQEIVNKLQGDKELAKIVDKIEVAGPGFINFGLRKRFSLLS